MTFTLELPRAWVATLLLVLGQFLAGLPSWAAEVLPPKPDRYFNDYASFVSKPAGARLNEVLADFERATSSQFLVATYPKMDSPSSIEDYTQRISELWKVGQADKKNGVVLFLYKAERKMFIQVGYGLEGALPDALCKQIIENEIKPRFQAGDFEGGLTAGINAIIQASKGEYKGTGRIVGGTKGKKFSSLIIFLLFLGFMIISSVHRSRSAMYGRGGRRIMTGGAWPSFGGFGGGGGFGGFGSGGGGSGGGGGGFSGFSGGGGSFGGGGAGGNW